MLKVPAASRSRESAVEIMAAITAANMMPPARAGRRVVTSVTNTASWLSMPGTRSMPHRPMMIKGI